MENKYFVKSVDRFNLDSMRVHLWCVIYELQEKGGKSEIMGKEMEIEEVTELKNECERLELKSRYGKVNGKEYGRIKEISLERQMLRYATCIKAGMNESKASLSFE